MFSFKKGLVKGLMLVGLLSFSMSSDVHTAGRVAKMSTDPVELGKLSLEQIEATVRELLQEKQERQVLREAGDYFLSTTAEQEAALADIAEELAVLRLYATDSIRALDEYVTSENAKSHLGNYGFVYVSHVENMKQCAAKRQALQTLLSLIDSK